MNTASRHFWCLIATPAKLVDFTAWNAVCCFHSSCDRPDCHPWRSDPLPRLQPANQFESNSLSEMKLDWVRSIPKDTILSRQHFARDKILKGKTFFCHERSTHRTQQEQLESDPESLAGQLGWW